MPFPDRYIAAGAAQRPSVVQGWGPGLAYLHTRDGRRGTAARGAFSVARAAYGVAEIGALCLALFADCFVARSYRQHSRTVRRRTVFTFSLYGIRITTAIMEFQTSGFGRRSVALYCRIGIAIEWYDRHLMCQAVHAQPSRSRFMPINQ